MLSVSIALLIQAIFFGDGGITTFGANCFNMAIAGSLVAHFVYRAIAGEVGDSVLAAGCGCSPGGLCGHQCFSPAYRVRVEEFSRCSSRTPAALLYMLPMPCISQSLR